MTFTVASNSFKDGDYLRSDFILSSDFGFGCAGTPAASLALRFRKFILSVGAPAPRAQYDGFLFSSCSF
jgi:hypothetical protein